MSWPLNKAVKFEFDIATTKVPYNLYVNVRNSESYPYKNLWLFIRTKTPSGKVEVDSLDCKLADDTGKWLGDGAGDIWDNKIPFKNRVGFPEVGKYTVEIQHGMRSEPLPAVLEVGLLVEKSAGAK
jgi:gliding motility-associated lipoprotein GldH